MSDRRLEALIQEREAELPVPPFPPIWAAVWWGTGRQPSAASRFVQYSNGPPLYLPRANCESCGGRTSASMPPACGGGRRCRRIGTSSHSRWNRPAPRGSGKGFRGAPSCRGPLRPVRCPHELGRGARSTASLLAQIAATPKSLLRALPADRTSISRGGCGGCAGASGTVGFSAPATGTPGCPGRDRRRAEHGTGGRSRGDRPVPLGWDQASLRGGPDVDAAGSPRRRPYPGSPGLAAALPSRCRHRARPGRAAGASSAAGEQRAHATSTARAVPDPDGGRRQRAGAPLPGAAGGQTG